MIWVINTNSNLCRIYDYQKAPAKLTLLKEINHPENKMKTGDYLTSDKPGHYQTSSAAHGTFSQPSDPKAVAIDDFSREIARELNHGRTTNCYEKLILVTPPHMSGLLHQHLDKHVAALVTHNIPKDVVHLTEKEFLDFLHVNAQYVNQ